MIIGDQTDTLFAALAEQLKTPLLQIARLSELKNTDSTNQITAISEHALRLVDAYMHTQAQAQAALILEPINASSVLYDAAHTLEPYARQFGCSIDIDLRGKSAPIMGHRHSLQTMMTLLGASLIESASENEPTGCRLVLGSHRSARGTVVGVFSRHVSVSEAALLLVRKIHGRASQVAPTLGMAGGAGLAIADQLSEQLSSPLKAYRHNSLSGIGALLLPSRQLYLLL